LKRELAKISTENEILRATSSSGLPNGASSSHGPGSEPATTGPMKFTPKDFSSLTIGDGQPDPVHRIVYCEETGEKLLDARATWNMIQSHMLVKEHLADVGDICERLKRHARCDGQGPVFEEGRVLTAIKESVAGGNDELI
jgi:AP-1-like transcription factor